MMAKAQLATQERDYALDDYEQDESLECSIPVVKFNKDQGAPDLSEAWAVFELCREGRAEHAFDLMKTLSIEGDLKAHFLLSNMYRFGIGTKVDKVKANQWSASWSFACDSANLDNNEAASSLNKTLRWVKFILAQYLINHASILQDQGNKQLKRSTAKASGGSSVSSSGTCSASAALASASASSSSSNDNCGTPSKGANDSTDAPSKSAKGLKGSNTKDGCTGPNANDGCKVANASDSCKESNDTDACTASNASVSHNVNKSCQESTPAVSSKSSAKVNLKEAKEGKEGCDTPCCKALEEAQANIALANEAFAYALSLLNELKECCDYVPAFYEIGKCYYYGMGVDKDPKKAYELFTTHEKCLYGCACFAALTCLHPEQKGKSSVTLLRKYENAIAQAACTLTHPELEWHDPKVEASTGQIFSLALFFWNFCPDFGAAVYALTMFERLNAHVNGKEGAEKILQDTNLDKLIEQDDVTALMQKAAALTVNAYEHKHPQAKRNFSDAASLLKRGAALKDTNCCALLGAFYLSGVGVKKDLTKAQIYMTMAKLSSTKLASLLIYDAKRVHKGLRDQQFAMLCGGE